MVTKEMVKNMRVYGFIIGVFTWFSIYLGEQLKNKSNKLKLNTSYRHYVHPLLGNLVLVPANKQKLN